MPALRAPLISAAAAVVNIEAMVGDELTVRGTVTENDLPFNPATVTFDAAVIDQDGETAVAVTAALGQFTIDFTPVVQTWEPGRYRWYLRADYPLNPFTWLGGVLELKAPGTGSQIRVCDVAVVLRDTNIAVDFTFTGGSSGGGGNVVGYVHEQLIPAATWTIPHGLGYWPSITCVRADGTVIDALITHDPGALEATAEYNSPQTGIARCV